MARPAPAVSPARVLAFEVVRRVFESGAWADRVLGPRLGELAPRDRGLATALAYGTVQRRATLDHVAARLVDRPLERLEPAVLAGLRLGLFQLLYLGGVADHAAVNETVTLVKTASRGGGGLVNAVLRRAAREGEALVGGLGDDTPETAALAHSVPEWLARMWWEELGPARTRALLAAVNRPAESGLRVNTLRANPAQVSADLPVAVRPAAGLPEGLVLEGAFDAHGSPLWAAGAITPQSRGSMLVARALDPPAGGTVLDLCAAPGAKTTQLAALGAGHVVAVERHPGRAQALAATCARMGADVVDVVVADAAAVATAGAPSALRAGAGFDAVLVDPPCSGLGTMQSRPDLRWHADPAQIGRLSVLQERILAAGAELTRPGGVLVYSVCTISAAEGPGLVERFLAGRAGWRAEPLAERHPEYAAAATGPYLQLLPDREGTDGFFIARLRRE